VWCVLFRLGYVTLRSRRGCRIVLSLIVCLKIELGIAGDGIVGVCDCGWIDSLVSFPTNSHLRP
jgi:hypothetical protein